MPFEPGNNVGVQFSSENQPVSNGRPLGVKNRSTIARKVLDYLIRIPDDKYADMLLVYPDLEQQVSVEEYITLQQAVLATKETNAYKAVMDSAYGAPKQEIEGTGNLVQAAPIIKVYNTGPGLAASEEEISE